jgi:hypothetical protein
MKKIYVSIILLLFMLIAVGCRFDLKEMGIPFIPTNTYTPLPPPTRTPTPTYPPKPEISTGSLQTENLENDATLFTDSELAYQSIFPPEWLVVAMDSPLEQQLIAAFGEEVPDIFRNLLLTGSETEGLRMVALDYTYKYSFKPPANITLTFTANPAALEAEMLNVLEERIEAIPTRMPGSTVTYQNVQTNSKGLEYGKMIINQTDEDYNVPMRKMIALFKISDGLLVLTGTTPAESYTILESAFQKVIDSIQPIK